MSYISGLSNISGISGLSKNDKAPVDKERILEEEDIVGSEHYVSPEMLSSRESSYSSDLWAFGVIIYQLFAE